MTVAMRGLRILVVEDDPDVADILAHTLEDRGCVVVGTCASNKAALDSVRDDQPIDFVLLDLNLTDGQAFPTAAVLIARKIPFAFCTGGSFSASISAKCGHAARLFKPFRPSELIETMEVCLAGGSR